MIAIILALELAASPPATLEAAMLCVKADGDRLIPTAAAPEEVAALAIETCDARFDAVEQEVKGRYLSEGYDPFDATLYAATMRANYSSMLSQMIQSYVDPKRRESTANHE